MTSYRFFLAIVLLLFPALSWADKSVPPQAYLTHCAGCHGTALQGADAPALVGQGFLAAYEGFSVGEWYVHVANTMPPGGAGSVAHSDLAQIALYLLSRNGIDIDAQADDVQLRKSTILFPASP